MSNTILYSSASQKQVLITVIMGNSSNEKFNALQCIIGFFLESKCVPEIVIELLSHMGISVSTFTTGKMVNSLTVSARQRNKNLPPSMFIYDNFDLDFKVAQPTIGRSGTHVSMTSATFAPYSMSYPNALQFTKELHATSAFNKDIPPGDPRVYTPRVRDILPSNAASQGGLDALSKAFAWHIRAILVQQQPAFKIYEGVLGMPDAVQSLPVVKTVQFPASAINADEGQNDGNWQVLESMLSQAGVPDSRLEDDVILVHGDLSTKERIDALRKMRTIERTAKNRLDFVTFVPGLFHLKMAATDAFWRAHVEPSEGRADPMGFFEYVRHLRPKDSGKIVSSPGFRRLHDTIHHTTWIDVLDCWRLTAKLCGHDSLDEFASTKPLWASIIEMSEAMVKKYIPGNDFGDIRESDAADRDQCFENNAIRKQHGLLYLELCHSMNYGDVGRILRLFPYWIAFFKSTGKSKYTAHMIRFFTDLNHVYPPRLRCGTAGDLYIMKY